MSEPQPYVQPYPCPHGCPLYVRCSKCARDWHEAEAHRMLVEAFDRLATVLEKLEAKL